MLSQVGDLKITGQVASVAAALVAIPELRPELLVLDLQLSDGNGIQVLREAKRHDPNMKVIVFTNQPEAQYRRRCAQLGADYFLCKSTDSNLLIEIVAGLTTR